MNLSIKSHTVLVCTFRQYSRFTSLAHLSTVSQPFITDRAKSPLTRKAEILEKVLGIVLCIISCSKCIEIVNEIMFVVLQLQE